ncbi:hypothetical protein GGI09_004525 [Coemansia sp. S100]|nr:hypothetical protein GGI09_004525 [Coemansia sp. S100]
MNYADLINIGETVSGFYNRVGGPGEYVLRDVEHTLHMLDLRVEGSQLMAALLTDVRPCLAKLMGSMALTPTIAGAVSDSAPPPTVASAQVTATPVAGPSTAATTNPAVAFAETPQASLVSTPSSSSRL